MDAVITAGGIPSEKDPLYPYTQGKPKAMVDIAGKPMIQWILDAVSNSKDVEHVVLIGLDKSSGVTCSKPMEYIENQGHMLANIIAGIHKVQEMNPEGRVRSGHLVRHPRASPARWWTGAWRRRWKRRMNCITASSRRR